MHLRSIVSTCSLALVAAACSGSPPTPGVAGNDGHASPGVADVGSFAKSSNALGLDLYAKARVRPGNLALSPISIASALTMTWGGARGETAAQMKKVLHAEGESGPAMDVAGELLRSLGGDGSKVTLRVANRLFGEKTYAFDAAYLDHTKAAFGAPLEALDFRGDAESSRVHINDWVAGQTQDRIKNLIPQGGVDADTRLVLTNAIYFLGDWMTPFTKDATRPAAFHVTASASHDVPTMSQESRFRFASTDGVEVLEMPYAGGDVAMTFVLPDAPDGLDAVEKRLSPETIDAWTSAMKPEQVNVALPKFEIDPAASLSLGDTLKELGMPLAFDASKADFTGMSSPRNPGERLQISKVFHKAFVKLDEKGTEAAAATAVVISVESAIVQRKPPAEFKADHPFLFVLRHVKSGAILFMGRVSDPAAK